MNDLISRQALLDKFEPWLKVKDYNDGELNMLKAILYEIRFMPSAQPKRGKWKNIVDGIEYTWGTCDSCGARIPMPYKYYKYCPNCGIKNEVKHG